MTQEPLLTGEAHDGNERFNFAIKRFVTGGFLLEISYISDKGHGINGAGVWPSIEKAKEIAQETAAKLLHDASISWNEGKVSAMREIESAIRRVLMAKWDPIGVSEEPGAANEYDSYIWGVYGLLKRGVSDEEIAEHLLMIETESMGFIDCDGKPFATAQALLPVAAELREMIQPLISRSGPGRDAHH